MSGTKHLTNIATGAGGSATSENQDTQTTALQLIDDIVHTVNGAIGKAALIAGQLDDVGTTAATENAVASVRISAARGLHTVIRNDSGTEIFTATNPGMIQGPVAVAETTSGNPVLLGARAQSSSPTTSYAAGKLGVLTCDPYGRLLIKMASRANCSPIVTTITSSTSETTIASATAVGFRDVIVLVAANSSATGTLVTIRDATGGAARLIFYLPPTSTLIFPYNPAQLRQTTGNNNWTAQCGTSVASVYIQVYQELIADT